jgi:hypothetical protein
MDYPVIDFSRTGVTAPSHARNNLSWLFQFNIPDGLNWNQGDQSWRFEVLKLQRQYGCLNVTSGNPQPPVGGQIGVYIRPGDGRHRDGKLCTCWDGGTQRPKDLLVWPPRW